MNHRNVNVVVFAILSDALMILLASLIASFLRVSIDLGPQVPNVEAFPPYGEIVLTVIWLWGIATRGIYNPSYTPTLAEETSGVVIGTSLGLMVAAGLLYFTYRDVSRYLIGYFYVASLLLLVGSRFAMHFIFRLRNPQTTLNRVLIISEKDNPTEQRLHTLIEGDEVLNAKVVATLFTPQATDVIAFIISYQVNEVILVSSKEARLDLEGIINALDPLPVRVYVVPNEFNLALYRAQVNTLEDIPLISLRDPAFTSQQLLNKRIFDLLISVPLCLVLSPFMLIIGAWVRFTSSGGALYKQERVGENGKLFTFYKFRTMYENSPHLSPETLKTMDDPRITRIGKFLRRTSLDELPQLFNVLQGNMSLVGPRPEMPHRVALYEAWQRKRFAVPQGITGWWQVTGRSEKPMHLNTEDDLYYIQHYSFWLDLKILFKTVWVVLKGKGAY